MKAKAKPDAIPPRRRRCCSRAGRERPCGRWAVGFVHNAGFNHLGFAGGIHEPYCEEHLHTVRDPAAVCPHGLDEDACRESGDFERWCELAAAADILRFGGEFSEE